MEVKNAAMAGTLESSDVQITIEPSGDGITLDLSSSVLNRFGKQIKKTVLGTLENLGVKSARVTVVDRGALECTIKARVQCAVYRSAGQTENIPWGKEAR